ncbi:MAG: glycosyltransferase, partial [Kiritimatiellae bacterium]|nr:glycosyltransferase [Kiritimatiellia bacterium]
MRIAHVLRRLSPENWGGIEQEVLHLAKAQREAGHDVRIFATAALCATPAAAMDGVEVRRFPCVYPWWPMTGAKRTQLDLRGGNPFSPALERALRAWRPDVVHCHAMGRIAQLCVRAAERTGARCAVSLHGGAACVPAAEAE